MRSIALVLVLTSVARAELPPVTEGFRESAHLRLQTVLGAYPWRHAAEITAVGFSRDGALLATAGGDRRIKIWRADGEELRTIGVVKGRTNEVGFAPDGATLFSASSLGTIALWDVATGAQRLLLTHGAAVTSAVYSPNGRRLVSVGRDRLVKVWDPASGALLATTTFVPTPEGGPASAFAAVEATDRLARVAFADGSVVEIELATGTPGRAIRRAIDVEAAAFSGDGRRLVAASGGELHVLDLASGADRLAARGLGPVADVAVSADGRRALVGGPDGRLTAWDLERNEILLDHVAHNAEITSVALSPSGALGASASRDYSFRLWDVGAGAAKPEPTGRALYAVTFLDDDQLVSGGADGEVRLWNLASATARVVAQHAGAVYALAALVATTVVTGGDDGTLRFVDVSACAGSMTARAHAGGDLAVAASADGKRLVTGGADERVRAWDLHRHRRGAELDMAAPAAAVALSPDGKHGVAGDDAGLVRFFDLPGLVAEARGHHAGLVLGARFAPDGKHVVTASEDGTLRLWSAHGKPGAVLEGHKGPVTCAVFTADGAEVISGAKDGTIVVWDVATGAVLDRLDLAASGDQPLALALTPDGQRLAVATARGVVLLYAVRSGP